MLTAKSGLYPEVLINNVAFVSAETCKQMHLVCCVHC